MAAKPNNLDSLLEEREEPIVCCGPEGQVLLANRAFHYFFQINFKKQLNSGADFFDQLSQEIGENWSPLANQAMAGYSGKTTYTVQRQGKDALAKHYEFSFAPYTVRADTKGWSLFIHDITAGRC